MKKAIRKLSFIMMLCLTIAVLGGCQGSKDQDAENPGGATPKSEQTEIVDYAAQVKLNMASNTAKMEVTVKTFVDGDTTHFNVSEDFNETGVLKARYLAINTPESTGKIEEWGKAASKFTKEKLSAATSIIVESDSEKWNIDSTGERYLVWVWYKTADSQEYRNLNIEILQNGLAIANSSANNRYGSYCMSAINQARTQKLYIYSGEQDPDFYYGESVELTLKELRCHPAEYKDIKVAFNGIITTNDGSSVYIEEYDPETDMYYGVSVYYGYNLPGAGLDVLTVGNEARIVGTFQYYEAGDTYQVSGLSYRQMKPDDPGNIKKLSEGNEAAYVLTSADKFVNGTVEIAEENGVQTYAYAQLAMSTSISMENLKVLSVYTTTTASSEGAMTLTCESDGVLVSVRTMVLLDNDGNLITADAYEGKTIDVKGIVDYYNGTYQIKVVTAKNITVK